MNKRELQIKRRDAAYQRLTVADFDQLIELVNRIRAVTQMNGQIDHLEPGGHQTYDCPLHQTVVYKPSAFGRGWTVSVEDVVIVSRYASGRQIKQRWPKLWAAAQEQPTPFLDLYHEDGYAVEIRREAGGGSGTYALAFSWAGDVIENFVAAFDDGEQARFLDQDLAADELAELLA